MFKQAVLKLYRAFIGSDDVRYLVLPPLAPFDKVETKAAANQYGDYTEIDDGTGIAATGGYDGEAWLAGIVIANPEQANEYYDIAVASGLAGHEVDLAIISCHIETTIPANHHAVYWLPKPIRIGAVPVRLAAAAADLNVAQKDIYVKLILEQGL